MKRLSQISILKKLVLESMSQPEIIFEGDLNVSPGLRICLYDKDKNMIGSTNVLDYDSAIGLDPDINRFNDKKTEYCRKIPFICIVYLWMKIIETKDTLIF